MTDLQSRPFCGEDDHEKVIAFLNGRSYWQQLPDYWNTGKSPIGIYLTMYLGKQDNHQLWLDGNGDIQAYTYLSPDENTPIYFTPELRQWRIFLHPDRRDELLFTQLVADAEMRLHQRTSRQPIQTVAYDSDRWVTAVLEQNGYMRESASDVYMTRSLAEEIAVKSIPSGFSVRAFAGESEIEQRAIVTNDAFGGFAESSEWAVTNTRRMMRFCRKKQVVDLVAVDDQGILASSAVVAIDPVTKLGEFDPVGTRHSYQRRGLASVLLWHGLKMMRDLSMETAVVRTGIDNIPAQRTYEGVGFQIVDTIYNYVKR
jgi:ribosomal protein S18 acetylase RimI-like enzyme